MATRSLILKHSNDGNLTGIYCHWDGYPDGVGRKLIDHYKDPAKVDSLLALGDISMLGYELSDTIAYCRDRKEEMSLPFVFASVEAIKDTNFEYAHVFDGTAWTTYDLLSGKAHEYQ